VEDYALYSALHRRFGKSWLEWPDQFRERGYSALTAARRDHAEEILERIWLQWQLDVQWHKAKAEARDQGVALMGDLPFIVGLDSADVWSHPRDFRADLRVGAPPDPGNPEGQDWGLPAYNWDTLQRSELGWIRARAARARDLFTTYRVDHVIGFYRTYVRSPDGSAGFWPAHESAQLSLGETIMRAMRASGEVIAEDLGAVPPFLRPSLERLRIPGYKVLRWEKEGEAFRDPATWPRCSVATNATHDTDATADWYDNLQDDERTALLAVPGLEGLEEHPKFDDAVRDTLLSVLYRAPSDLTIVPFQDALGHRERINQPGVVAESNWSYRMPMDVKTLDASPDAARLLKIAREAKRK
jgi:4-alpha-glucanotransferase